MVKVSRRVAIAGGAVAVGGGAAVVLGRKSDISGPRQAYFLEMQRALKAANIAQPTLVIDRARLNANIDYLIAGLPAGMGFRAVSKSLPSLDLLKAVRERSGTDRMMTFNLPMLTEIAAAMPDVEQLLGKPMPARALQNFFDGSDPAALSNGRPIQWLIDSPERLAQYDAIVGAQGAQMRVNIELDVGLHRGGMVPGDALAGMVQAIAASDNLTFAGFMGYEPHITHAPTVMGWQDRVKHNAWNTYTGALELARAAFGEEAVAQSTRNAAGSPTYRLYENTNIANEISVGSALVKPTDFDTELLEGFEPAAFIATPALKVMQGTQSPVMEIQDGAKRFMNPNLDKTIFIHGGYWKAKPEDPPGLDYNEFYGRSSNQEMLNGGPATDIAVDDFVFLRPTQSEAVFLQFGDIAVYDEGQITEYWPVFPASA